MDRIELKLGAKQRVQGNRWSLLKANIIAGIITYAIATAISFIAITGLGAAFAFDGSFMDSYVALTDSPLFMLGSLLSNLVSAPLTMGVIMYYNEFDKEDFADINILFKPFKHFFKIFVITVFTQVLITLGTLFFIIPGLLFSYSFVIIPYVYMKHPELGVMDMVSTAWRMMKGHKMNYFILELSFIGWSLLVVFTCGLFAIWLTPYYQMTLCRFFNEIDNTYFMDTLSEENTPSQTSEEEIIHVDVSEEKTNEE